MVPVRASSHVARWRWLVAGQVQGVGFRPFVYRLARQLNLGGFVRNDSQGVTIECQGETSALAEFETGLKAQHPATASIREIRSEILRELHDQGPFQITISQEQDHATADVTVDTATCAECVSEILSLLDRRRGYALTNCTQCGPRYSIVRAVPYDRCNTTMAHFKMCAACGDEYSDPADRRFHAQPIACHDCGPKLSLVNPHGEGIAGDPIALAQRMLRDGKIVAIKGLGGFHLAVRADDSQAVARLRHLKQRDHKPFALMVPSIAAARTLVKLSERAQAIMQSPACPIVLAERRNDADVAPEVAPGQHRLGVMLPYTPLQHLLFADLPTLVMTSGNVSDEPLVIDNDEAVNRLGPMCDAILLHDRPIQRGVDDSVLIDYGNDDPIIIRRARGHVPSPISLCTDTKTRGLCLGGELKNTVAVVRDNSVILSHHLGDLTHPSAFDAFRTSITDLCELFQIEPQWIAHDSHPMYVSSIHARKLAEQMQLPLIAVQHHHAHAAALMAEHGIDHRILAVVCDGTGYAPDGTIWGGELLSADLSDYQRLACLRPLRLPGGDAAAREPIRSALALLFQAWGSGFEDLPITRKLIPDADRRRLLCQMICLDVSCIASSGAGRVFDGVASLLGICQKNHFEGQAAMALESAAWHGRHPIDDQDLFNIRGPEPWQIDFSPLIRSLVTLHAQGLLVQRLAYLFHEQFARAWAAVVVRESNRTGIRDVGLSGGVFCNAILTRRLSELLESHGLRVLRHRVVPPNDGGLSLGQAAIAAARFCQVQGKRGTSCA